MSVAGIRVSPDYQYAVQQIRARMRTNQSRQKNYFDDRRTSLRFEVDNIVFMKVVLMKGVLRFKCKGN